MRFKTIIGTSEFFWFGTPCFFGLIDIPSIVYMFLKYNNIIVCYIFSNIKSCQCAQSIYFFFLGKKIKVFNPKCYSHLNTYIYDNILIYMRPGIRYFRGNICNKLCIIRKRQNGTINGIRCLIEVVYRERNINIIFKLIFTDVYFYFSSFSCIMVIRATTRPQYESIK